MASYARSYLSSLREDPMKKKLMNTLGAIVVAIIYIVSGSFIIVDQKIIKDLDNSKKDDFHYFSGVFNVILGVLIGLYLLYSIFIR